jgi:hypothetical protein
MPIEPSTQELSATPSCSSRRKTSGEKRLPTGRPVTSAGMTTTLVTLALDVVVGQRHVASHPPSTGSCAPVMYEASSERRNEIAAATSSGSPTRDQVHPLQVRVEDEVPLVLLQVLEGRHPHQPGVVHEVVQGAEGLQGAASGRLDLDPFADVAPERRRPSAGGGDLLHCLPGGLRRTPATATEAPSLASRIAVARPMPEPAPVTNAALPEWSKLIPPPRGRTGSWRCRPPCPRRPRRAPIR